MFSFLQNVSLLGKEGRTFFAGKGRDTQKQPSAYSSQNLRNQNLKHKAIVPEQQDSPTLLGESEQKIICNGNAADPSAMWLEVSAKIVPLRIA